MHLSDISAAAERIDGMVQCTPAIPSSRLSAESGRAVTLKLENTQTTGSFKLRGAASKLLSLSPAERHRGVAAVSSGNHGRAVAYAGQRLGVPVTIFLTSRVPAIKVQAIEQLGARVVVAGADQDEAEAAVRAFVDESDAVLVHPYDDPLVIAGQGTVGLELARQCPDVDQVLVPLSGGGLLAGVAVAMKATVAGVEAIGVSQEHGAAMHEALLAGHVVEIVEEDTLADALAGGLNMPNLHTFDLCRANVDATLLVTEAEIAAGMAFLMREHRLGVEGGGAVGVAALLAGKVAGTGPVAVVISGGNVDLELLLTTL